MDCGRQAVLKYVFRITHYIISFVINHSHHKQSILIILFVYLFFFKISRWEDFRRQMQDMLRHSDHKGIELKKPSGSLYTFPTPDCMCNEAEARNENSNTTRPV